MNRHSTGQYPAATPARLWSNWLLATGAWALHLFVSYGFVEWYCRNTESLTRATAQVILHALTALCFAVAIAGGIFAWRLYRGLAHDAATPETRRRQLMSAGGVGLSAFLAGVILVQWLPNMVLEPCL